MAAVLGQEHGLYDSGDEWEVGVGDLIIDLDADLEKDRRRAEEEKIMVAPSMQKESKTGAAGKDLKMKVKRSKGVNGAKTSYSISDLNVGKKDGDSQYDFDGESSPGAVPTAAGKAGKAVSGQDKPGKARGGSGGKGGRNNEKANKDGGNPSKEGLSQHDEPTGTNINSLSSHGNEEGQKSASSAKNAKREEKAATKGKSSPKKDKDKSKDSSHGGKTSKGSKKASKAEKADKGQSGGEKTKQPTTPLMPPPPPPPPPAPTPSPISAQSPVFIPTMVAPTTPPSVRHVGTNTTEIGVVTEPECLGPCEPGTSVNLEGIVWHETDGGVLVVNVTWRNKTYVGTLLDCSKHDWAPPRFSESPTSDIETKPPPPPPAKASRGKRARSNNNASSEDMSNFTETRSSIHSKLRNNNGNGNNGTGKTGRKGANKTPTKDDDGKPDTPPGTKRKAKSSTDGESVSSTDEVKPAKRIRANSRSTPTPQGEGSSPALIECPHVNCNKKYKHINGLRYHQAHAHLEDAKTGSENRKDNTATAAAPSALSTLIKEEKLLQQCMVAIPDKLRELADRERQNLGSNDLHKEDGEIPNKVLDSLEKLDSLKRKEQDNIQLKESESLLKIKAEAASEYDFPGVSFPAERPVAKTAASSAKGKFDFFARGRGPRSQGRNNSGGQDGREKSKLDHHHGVQNGFQHAVDTLPYVGAHPARPGAIPSRHSDPRGMQSGSINSMEGKDNSNVGSPTAPPNVTVFQLPQQQQLLAQQTSVIQSTTSHTERDVAAVVEKSKTSSDKEKSKKSSGIVGSSKNERSMSKTKAARPIAPAPTVPHLIAIPSFSSSNVSATGIQAISTTPKTPSTSALKPIQPKPTIMGEPPPQTISVPNFKEKKHKQKKRSKDKNKDKEKDRVPKELKNKEDSKGSKASDTPCNSLSADHSEDKSSSKSNHSSPPQKMAKFGLPLSDSATGHTTLTDVISSVLLRDSQGRNTPSTVRTFDNNKFSFSSTSPGVTSSQSPLAQPHEASRSENGSPAYSDISDEGNDPTKSSGRSKNSRRADDRDPAPNNQNAVKTDDDGEMHTGFQSHYASIRASHTATSATASLHSPLKREADSCNDADPQSRTQEPDHKKSRPSSASSRESTTSPDKPEKQRRSPHQQHQQRQSQNPGYAQYPHYQYLAYHGYRIDPAYHNYLTAADPQYRQQYEKLIEDQQARFSADQERKIKDAGKENSERSKGGSDFRGDEKGDGKDSDQMDSSNPPQLEPIKDARAKEDTRDGKSSPPSSSASYPSQPPPLKRADDTDSLKAKQSENHQIMRESIALKAQLESGPRRVSSSSSSSSASQAAMGFDPRILYAQQQEEMRQYYLYQQRVAEQHKMEDERRRQIKAEQSQNRPDQVRQNHSPRNDQKQRHSDGGGSRKETDKLSAKPKEPSSGQSSRSSTPSKKSPSLPPKEDSKETDQSSKHLERRMKESRDSNDRKTQDPRRDSASASRQVPYPYMSQYSYMHPYAAMHLDPAYRGMYPIGYAGAPYVHPQFRYQGEPADSPQQGLGSTYKGQSTNAHDRPPTMSPAPGKGTDSPDKQSTSKKTHTISHYPQQPSPRKEKEEAPAKQNSPSSPAPKETSSEKPTSESGEKADRKGTTPQHHVHTHHHTHIGVGFPVVGQYDPYNVLTGQQSPGVVHSPMASFTPRRE